MVQLKENVHPKSLPFSEQRRVVILRDKGRSWEDIAQEVHNLQGQPTTWGNCRNIYRRLNRKSGLVKNKYGNCGRRKKLTPSHEKWLLKTFLALRSKGPVVAADLQGLLASQRRVRVEVSLVRKSLQKHGYRWLPRGKKVKFSDGDRALRKAFADKVLKLSDAQLREKLTMSHDGTVIVVPPTKLTQRLNFCRATETHCWRKSSEAFEHDLAGADPYHKQAPLSRLIPLWGGCSAAGFAPIVWHQKRKMDEDEWVEVLEAGQLTQAIKALKPVRPRGPWFVLSDNESFLKTRGACEYYKKARIKMWFIPPRSPDLNPIEKFWSWLRRELRRRDLIDLQTRKKVLPKLDYLKRVRAVLRSPKAQEVAASCVMNFRKTCQTISDNGGAGVKG